MEVSKPFLRDRSKRSVILLLTLSCLLELCLNFNKEDFVTKQDFSYKKDKKTTFV